MGQRARLAVVVELCLCSVRCSYVSPRSVSCEVWEAPLFADAPNTQVLSSAGLRLPRRSTLVTRLNEVVVGLALWSWACRCCESFTQRTGSLQRLSFFWDELNETNIALSLSPPLCLALCDYSVLSFGNRLLVAAACRWGINEKYWAKFLEANADQSMGKCVLGPGVGRDHAASAPTPTRANPKRK